MLTKGAIGNLVNRYKAVLKKCNLINTFGSLAVASMLVLGGAGVAGAAEAPMAKDGQLIGHVTEQCLVNSRDYPSTSIPEYAYVDMNGWNMTFENKDYASLSPAIYVTPTNAATEEDNGKWGMNIKDTSGKSIFTAISHRSTALWSNGRDNSIQAKEIHLTSLATNTIYTTSGSVTLDADIVKITSEKGNGVQAQGGKFTINASETTITVKDGKHAIRVADYPASEKEPYKQAEEFAINTGDLTINASSAIKHGGNSLVKINATGLSKITGDILVYDNNSQVELSIAGTNSFLKGAINQDNIKEDGGVNFKLNDATWIPTASSSLKTFSANGGVIDLRVLDEGNALARTVPGIAIGTGSGSCTVLMNPDGSSTVNVATDNGFEVTGTTVENADKVTDSQAKNMYNRIQGTETKSVEIEEGKTRGAMTVTGGADGQPDLTIARNSLMDDALTMASVNTVSLDRILTNDVRKRLGDIRSDKNTSGVWMRWDGGKLKGDSGLANNFNTIQIGGDTKVGTNCRLGVAGSFTHGDTDFARGNGELEGFSFALYSTWMGDNGMFADVVARLGHFSTEMNVEGDKGDMDNRVASLSGEYGWRFDLCQQFFIEPQVELAYTYVNSEDLQLGDAKYQFDSVDSLTGRAGLVAGWKLPDDRGNVYARASVLQQFMGDAKISGTIDGIGNIQEIDGNDTWMEYGIGANIKLTDKTYIWADIERTEGADIEEEWRGTVGIRYSF